MIAASVWMTSRRVLFSVEIVRCSAETMPDVTVGDPSSARALPIATTESPTSTALESPISTTGSLVRSIFTTARSWPVSTPRTVAVAVFASARVTLIEDASAATCALVTITPLLATMNPVPVPRPSGPLTSMRTTAGCTLRRIAWMSPFCTMTEAGRTDDGADGDDVVP